MSPTLPCEVPEAHGAIIRREDGHKVWEADKPEPPPKSGISTPLQASKLAFYLSKVLAEGLGQRQSTVSLTAQHSVNVFVLEPFVPQVLQGQRRGTQMDVALQ